MKKLLFLAFFLFAIVSSSLVAQGTTQQKVFAYNLETQASILAAADDMIDELIDEKTGEPYFVRKIENSWSGEIAYVEVFFDFETTTFVDLDLYAVNGEDDSRTEPKKPCPHRQDSCVHKQPNVLKNKDKEELRAKPKPRRSSRVKLANNF